MPRVLAESEYNAIRDHLLSSAPDGLTEQQFQTWIGPRMEAALGTAENSPAPVTGSTVGRLLSNFGEMVNPVAIAEGLYGAARHPIDTATGVLSDMGQQGKTAIELARNAKRPADYVQAGGHALAAAIPILGPAAAQAGEQIASGDVAGGIGKGAGILLPAAIPTGVRAVRGAARAIPNAVADAADAGAASRVADVISPKVGANKVRIGNRAEAIAPQLAKDLAEDGAPLSRSAFHQQVQGKLAASEQGLDAASDARLAARSFPTQPLIADLMKKRAELTSEAVDASKVTPKQGVTRAGDGTVTITKTGTPLGEDIVPGPNAGRVAVIDQAISELKALGPVTRYDPIRTIRQAYDQVAKVKYIPSAGRHG